MAITPQSAKSKGRRLQQWVRDKLYSTFPKLEDGDIRSTSMGSNGEDLLLSPAARRCFPYSVECKSNKSFAVYKIMDQATENCPKGATPIAVIKADRQKPLVVVDAEHFLNLLREVSNETTY